MKTLRMRVCSARLLGSAFAALLLTSTLAPAPASADTDLDVGGEGVIAYANGDNVRLRTGPSYQDTEIARFPEGATVEVLDGPFRADDESDWYKVSIDGETGYIVSDFLANSDGIFSETSGTANTRDSVHIRSGPGTAESIVTTLAAGEMVTLTGGYSDGWLSVSATGGDGWVYGAFLGSGNPEEPGPAGTRYTIDAVHLRSGPATSYDSITYLDAGVQLELTGDEENGFVSVSSSFGDGWVYSQYIAADAPAEPEPPAEPGETGTRYTIDTVHLRSGPATSASSITYFKIGVPLELTGQEENGFVSVSSSFGDGWVFAEYIGADAPAAPETPEEPEEPAEPVTRYTTAAVNLRTGSNQNATVVTVLPAGTEVQFAGVTASGFSQVTTAAGAGWVSSEFLSETEPEESQEPVPSDSLITWPVEGGEWVVSQGYNGSSHQNRSSSWQYYYSFDLKRSDGSTTGQPIYSAVNGTIRWIDEATGGMSIYMGDGLAYAFFHANLDPGLREGNVITQGQYMGTIAPDGQASNGGSAHLHITVWETSDEGNWSRRAIPFTGNVAIEGVNFPADGGGNDWRGYTFNP